LKIKIQKIVILASNQFIGRVKIFQRELKKYIDHLRGFFKQKKRPQDGAKKPKSK